MNKPNTIAAAAAEVAREIKLAETIIIVLLKNMTLEQQCAAGYELESAGVSPDGMTRYHERRAAHGAFNAAASAGIETAPKESAEFVQPIAPEFWDLQTVAEKAGISLTKAQQLVRGKSFPSSQRRQLKPGRWKYAWPARGVQAWIEEQKRAQVTPVLFCKDCKHFDSSALKSEPRCMASAARKADVVLGYHPPLCRAERASWDSACGSEGALFEPAAIRTDGVDVEEGQIVPTESRTKHGIPDSYQ